MQRVDVTLSVWLFLSSTGALCSLPDDLPGAVCESAEETIRLGFECFVLSVRLARAPVSCPNVGTRLFQSAVFLKGSGKYLVPDPFTRFGFGALCRPL